MPKCYLLVSTLAFAISAIVAGLMRRYAVRVNMFDVPNDRSSHTIATPRGGGTGIVIVFLGAVVGVHILEMLPLQVFAALLVGGALVSVVGFMDDHKHVAARWRFLAQLFAAAAMLLGLGGLPEIPISTKSVDLGPAGDLVALIAIVWFINLHNFMDGIDGIAGVQAVCVSFSALIISAGAQNAAVTTLLAVFAASVLGFLIWNWPPAKIFLGDVGSGFIGFVLAALAIYSSEQGVLSIWTWIILASVFLVDATVTLLTRLLRGEQWYLAHHNHAYQKAARRVNSHQSVTLAVLLINVLWLFPLAWFASARPDFGWWLTIVAWMPLVFLSWFLEAGRPDPVA